MTRAANVSGWVWTVNMNGVEVGTEAQAAALDGVWPDRTALEFDGHEFDADEFQTMIAIWNEEQLEYDETQDCLDTLLETRTVIAALQAREQRSLARLDAIAQASVAQASAVQASAAQVPAARPDAAVHSTANSADMAWRSMVAEIAVATRTADRTVQAMLGRARALVSTLPATLDALEGGRISMGHARVILEHATGIEGDARREYERITLARAEATTPGKLATTAKIAAARLREESFDDRHAIARALRRVTISELDDGMSELTHVVPTVYAAAVFDRLTRQAKAVTAAGDPRTRDELRSDIALDLLLTGEPELREGDNDAPHSAARGIRAEVSIVIPALALLELDDVPATLRGRGPIDLDTACSIAAGAPELIRVLTHPVSNLVIACDSYRPTASLRRYLEARDRYCRFPSCHRDARHCDIDHTVAWEHGGTTVPENLAVLCRGHHTLKHHSRWRVKQVTPGVLEWTSPLGRIIATESPGETEISAFSGAQEACGVPEFLDTSLASEAEEPPAPF